MYNLDIIFLETMENFKPDQKESIEKEPNVRVGIMSREDELKRIYSTLERIRWYRENGYYLDDPTRPDDIVLPEYYDKIAKKILAGEMLLEDIKQEEFEQALEYSREDYLEAATAVENEMKNQKHILSTFSKWHDTWGFKTFENYSIFLTKHGTSGNFYYDSGTAIMRVGIKEYLRAAIHEFVHIGIEEAIIQKYGLSHWEKERVVDLICKNALNLAGERMQRQDDPDLARLDKFISIDTADNLPEAIEKYLQDKKSTK